MIYVIDYLGRVTAIIQNINAFDLRSEYIHIDDFSTCLVSLKITDLLARINSCKTTCTDMWVPEFSFKPERNKILVDMWDENLSLDEAILKLKLNN